MSISAIILLIPGILFIILGILLVNHYILHPERERNLTNILFPFILGIIFITSVITGYGLIILLFLIIISIITYIYSKYASIKHPEMKKQQDEYKKKSREMYRKHPFYKILRICKYIILACAVFFGLFLVVVVLFNITF